MSCSDCSNCNKRYECSQAVQFNCPFNQVGENIPYSDILNTIKIKLTECLCLIKENRKDEYDLKDYEHDISSIFEKIKEDTSEKMINEYKKLFKKL